MLARIFLGGKRFIWNLTSDKDLIRSMLGECGRSNKFPWMSFRDSLFSLFCLSWKCEEFSQKPRQRTFQVLMLQDIFWP